MGPAHGVRVLVIDDDPDIRNLVALALEDGGYEARDAADGHQALDSLLGWRPDVILLDLNMPRCDARRFRDRQRVDPDLGSIPVVVMSADRNLATVGEALGARAQLPKPFTLEQLYRAVESGRGDPLSSQGTQ